jgi:hypothetical protein
LHVPQFLLQPISRSVPIAVFKEMVQIRNPNPDVEFHHPSTIILT